MTQATTPTFTLTLPDTVDLTEAASVYFTLEQGQTKIRKTGADLNITAHQVDVYLSQAESKDLWAGSASLQLNWVYANGSRACSNIAKVQVKHNLERGVLE